MKEKIIILLFALLPVYAFSQQAEYLNAFDAEKTVWTWAYRADYFNPSKPGYSLYTTVLYGDTVINDIKWKIFIQSVAIDCFNIKGLIRTEDSKVLFRAHPDWEECWWGDPNDTTIVLYDFSLEVGGANISYNPVLKIDSVELNDGRMHKRMHYKFGNPDIEGLGNESSPPFYMAGGYGAPTSDMDDIGDKYNSSFYRTKGYNIPNPWYEYPTLICCHVNDQLLYINPAFVDCDGTEAPNGIIEKELLPTKVTMTDNQLQVIYGNGEPFDVKVYTMEGKLVAQQNGNYQEATMAIGHLNQGVYLVQVVSDKEIYTRKIVK